jgi:hypothetical protein
MNRIESGHRKEMEAWFQRKWWCGGVCVVVEVGLGWWWLVVVVVAKVVAVAFVVVVMVMLVLVVGTLCGGGAAADEEGREPLLFSVPEEGRASSSCVEREWKAGARNER